MVISLQHIKSRNQYKKKRNVSKYIKQLNTKANNAILVVAKLDRLARDVSFTSALYNGNVLCVVIIHLLINSIQILSVIAENEAEMISVRTKETLAIKKLI
jgi:DNA invertase Pin-like site-specific DNA recombinase